MIMMRLYMEMMIAIETMKTPTEMATPQEVVGILHQGGTETRPHPLGHPPLEARVEQ